MSPSRQIDDDAIEAVLQGEQVDERFEPFVTFAHKVRAARASEPVPPASVELLALLEGTEPVALRPVLDPSRASSPRTGRSRRSPRRKRVPFASGLASASAKLAGLGALTKIGLGTSVALASVTAAGAAGVMPESANDAVRGAIETVTPVEFPTDADHDVRVTNRTGVDGTDTETEVDGHGGANVEADSDNPSVGVNGGVSVDETLPTLPPVTLPPVTLPPVPEVPGIPGGTLPLPTVPTTLPDLP
jgi:hypothetical protein